MATPRDVALRPLDLVTNGQAQAFGDAAHVTQNTAPSDVNSSAVVGTSLDAARTDHQHRGVASVEGPAGTKFYGAVAISQGSGISVTDSGNGLEIAATGPAVNKNQISVNDPGQHQTTQADGETVLVEENVKPDAIAVQTSVLPFLAALVKASNAAATNTIRLRVGGTIGTADGSVVASFTTVSAAFEKKGNSGGAFDLTGVPSYSAADGVLVKVTAQVSGGAGTDTIDFRGANATLSG